MDKLKLSSGGSHKKKKEEEDIENEMENENDMENDMENEDSKIISNEKPKVEKSKTIEEIRKARLAFFDKK